MKHDSENTRFELGKPFFIHYCEKKLMGDWELQYHDTLEIFFLIEGKYNFFIDDKMYELRSGDMVLIPPGTLHKAFGYENVPLTRYIVYCNTSFVPKSTSQILLSSGHYVERIPKALGDLEDLFFKLCKEYHNPDLLSDELIHGYITELAAFIMRAEKTRGSTDMKSSNSVVESVISYLKDHYAVDVSLEDVAHHVSVSTAHLSRTFKQETGLGIREYLTMYRLKQAELMLIEFPSKSISEIAYNCGFNDSNYFASSFKRNTGITPTEFRKKVLHG